MTGFMIGTCMSARREIGLMGSAQGTLTHQHGDFPGLPWGKPASTSLTTGDKLYTEWSSAY